MEVKMSIQRRNEAEPNSAVVYARFSSHNQREESIDAQIRACNEYAKRKKLEIVKYYTDSAKTGTNADRKGFQEMIEDSGKGLFKYLIIHKIDRFSRDKFDAVTYKRKLKMNGVTILSVTENLDNSPESVMLESCLEGMAQYYSLNLSREVMKGMTESAYKCTHLGGIPPLGYDVDPVTRKYVVNEAEADIVRYIFTSYAANVGYNRILNYINGMGYKTKRGGAFGKNSLYTILANEKYAGKFIFNKKVEKDLAGKRNPHLKPREEWIVIDDGIPAIIDQETYDIVQIKMRNNKHAGGRFKAKEPYLLSGLVFCGQCGANMYGNTRICGRGKTKYSSYRCSARANRMGCQNKEIRKEYLESYVLDELYSQLFNDHSIQALSTLLSEYNRKKVEENDAETKLAYTELEDVKQRISKIVRLVSESDVSIETVKPDLQRLEERKIYIEKYVEDVQAKKKLAIISEDTLENLIYRSKDYVKTHNIAECRNFIESYIEKVLIFDDRVEVIFKINVPDEAQKTVTTLKSEESIVVLKKEYRKVV
jgi:site-specific DNA recombinase